MAISIIWYCLISCFLETCQFLIYFYSLYSLNVELQYKLNYSSLGILSYIYIYTHTHIYIYINSILQFHSFFCCNSYSQMLFLVKCIHWTSGSRVEQRHSLRWEQAWLVFNARAFACCAALLEYSTPWWRLVGTASASTLASVKTIKKWFSVTLLVASMSFFSVFRGAIACGVAKTIYFFPLWSVPLVLIIIIIIGMQILIYCLLKTHFSHFYQGISCSLISTTYDIR